MNLTGNVVVYVLETSLSPRRDDPSQTTQSHFGPTKIYIPTIRIYAGYVLHLFDPLKS